MDIETARMNMIKQQVRAWDVLNSDVLDLLIATPREEFVPQQYRRIAFAEENIPLAHDQVMMTPSVEGRIIQALAIQESDKILEVGTGSGYLTALLAKSGQHVYSVDLFADFLQKAEQKLTRFGISNVTLQEGNAAMGWPLQQPYDVICVTGALPILARNFQQQLKLFLVTS